MQAGQQPRPQAGAHLRQVSRDRIGEIERTVGQAEPALQNTCEGYAPRPDYRPLTKFENRGYGPGLFSPRALRGKLADFHEDSDFMADFQGAD